MSSITGVLNASVQMHDLRPVVSVAIPQPHTNRWDKARNDFCLNLVLLQMAGNQFLAGVGSVLKEEVKSDLERRGSAAAVPVVPCDRPKTRMWLQYKLDYKTNEPSLAKQSGLFNQVISEGQTIDE
jgi:hypothetical protein